MKITFGNIQHILSLLTTTEWINKYNPETKLKKLEEQLSNVSDPKKKASLENAIKNIQKNTSLDKPYIITLEHSGINANEAKILLANLHLLYSPDPDYKQESQEAIIQLLKRNFDKLNDNEIYKKTKKINVVDSNIALKTSTDLINVDLYNEILPYTKIIFSLYNYDNKAHPIEIATKLSVYFANFQDAINYLKTVDYTTKKQYH